MKLSPGSFQNMPLFPPTSLKFSGYIAYMSRSEAVRTESYASHNFAFDDMDFDGYNNYMSNPEKSSGLFSKDGILSR